MEIHKKQLKDGTQYLPKEISLTKCFINTIWIFISGFLGSVIVFAFLFLLSRSFGYSFQDWNSNNWFEEAHLYPFLLSLIVFFSTAITMLFTYFLLTTTTSGSYKRNMISFIQIVIFSILIYIFMIPIYLYMWNNYFENLFMIFLLHVIIVFLLFNIILELLNSYHHILLWVYSSFLWIILTIILILNLWFFDFSKWKVYLLIFLIPMINGVIYVFKQLTEFGYYTYFKFTWNDPIGNIFYQIEKEESEE